MLSYYMRAYIQIALYLVYILSIVAKFIASQAYLASAGLLVSLYYIPSTTEVQACLLYLIYQLSISNSNQQSRLLYISFLQSAFRSQLSRKVRELNLILYFNFFLSQLQASKQQVPIQAYSINLQLYLYFRSLYPYYQGVDLPGGSNKQISIFQNLLAYRKFSQESRQLSVQRIGEF